jgi:MYXO-CTERM domain-containing protein
MARRFVDCLACACLIHDDDSSCPFCGAAQRRTGAPLWLAASLVCGVGLADIACDTPRGDAPPQLREQLGTSSGGTTTGTSGTTGTTGTTGIGTTGTTIDDSTTFPDGSTYAGPDETTTAGGTTWSDPGETTRGSTSADHTTTTDVTTSNGPGETTSSSTSADGTTYAGPDETTTLGPNIPTEASSSDGVTSGATGETDTDGQPSVDKDGCGCTSRARPRDGLLGLLALAVLRRRRSSRRVG